MIYITAVTDESYGVIKKINSQIDSFKKAGLKCTKHNIRFNTLGASIIAKLMIRLPFINSHKHWKYDGIIDDNDIYIRKLGPFDKSTEDFFVKLKKLNPKCRIVLELPTYPYDKEYLTLTNFPFYIYDKYNRKNVKKYVDRIATLTDDNEIFGIPTLKIRNGIDLSTMSVRKVNAHAHDTINCIAVACFAWWHGYDRFLEGLRGYYSNGGTRNIIFHMVGDGDEIPKYKKMVSEYSLQDHVIFYGTKTGKNLDDVYDKCSLGIASLGGYRKNLYKSAELKSREYMAKGIPFVCSTEIVDIDEDCGMYLKVSNNDSCIKVEEVITFYDSIYNNNLEEEVIKKYRLFAEKNYSMDIAMKEVIDYFKSDER